MQHHYYAMKPKWNYSFLLRDEQKCYNYTEISRFSCTYLFFLGGYSKFIADT